MYEVKISRRDVSSWSESGQWLGGGTRGIADHGTVTETYGPGDLERHGDAVSWATALILRADAYGSSVAPVPAELPESAFLFGSYGNQNGHFAAETYVCLTGEWTPAERARVFRAVHDSVFGGDPS